MGGVLTEASPWHRLIPILASRAAVVQPRSTTPSGGGGRDVDCVAVGLDPMWPLRLPGGWRLLQSMRYCLVGWYWILDGPGGLVALDTIDDAWGIGREGIPTPMLLAEGEGEVPPPARAAYLAIKRVRKRELDADRWRGLPELVRSDVSQTRRILAHVLGPTQAERLLRCVLEGTPPDERTAAHVRHRLLTRRFGTPSRAMRALWLGTGRWLGRAIQPTGLEILVVGPDGVGKSTVARGILDSGHDLFRRTAHVHFRPGILPRPGALLARQTSDPAKPHAREPYGPAVSLALLAYHWLDFLVGTRWVRGGVRLRSGLLVVERGWWDLVVDPERYRLRVPGGLVRLLGTFLPRPDLAVVLAARPSVVHGRKSELSADEIERQSAAWPDALPRRVPAVEIDASLPVEEVVAAALREISDHLESRAMRRVGSGWVCLPPGRSTRWWLPRGPAAASAAGLRVHLPATTFAISIWPLAEAFARAGGFRLLPRGSAPPRELLEILAPHMPPAASLAVATATHPARYLALVVGRRGDLHAAAKVALDEEGRLALSREETSLRRLRPMLPEPLTAPEILHADSGLLVLEGVPWVPRSRPWTCPVEVAGALGAFHRAGRDGGEGPAHGDAVPWNLLRAPGRWVLIDWESATTKSAPWLDLCHFVTQAHALLGHPSAKEIREGFGRGAGWIGRAVAAYAEGAEVDPETALPALRDYLRDPVHAGVVRSTNESRGIRRRGSLLRSLGG